MKRRFAIAGKSEHVGADTFCLHFRQFFAESLRHLQSCRQRAERASLFVESTFTIDAVERASLAVTWKQIDSE